MAKSKSTRTLIDSDIPVTFNVSHVVVTDYIQAAIDREVSAAIEHAVADAVSEAVSALVEKIGRERVSKAIDQAMSDGWAKTNSYGEPLTGTRITVKDRISEILHAKDSYSSRGTYIDETIKRRVDEALSKDLKADIEAARNKFKAEVDAVLTATIREALAKNLGLKA